MAGPTYGGKPYKTPHVVWAAVMRTQSPTGRKAIQAYREEMWLHRQMVTAPPLTVPQTRMLRRLKTDLARTAHRASGPS